MFRSATVSSYCSLLVKIKTSTFKVKSSTLSHRTWSATAVHKPKEQLSWLLSRATQQQSELSHIMLQKYLTNCIYKLLLHLYMMFGFGLDKCQVPTKTALSLPLLSWAGERKCDERLETWTGRDDSPITVMGKTD